jgi:undecaprenyl-diphosphatase
LTYPQALVLGVVQGLTEFLPVSSSGHLILVPHVFGWPDQGLAFDAMMHVGTLAALVAYFRKELLAMASGAMPRRIAVLLIVATVPAAMAGVLLERVIETHLRSPLLIAATTAIFGILMWLADRRAKSPLESGRETAGTANDPLEAVSWPQALAVGCAQALALVPGTSRSGVTMTAGLFGGLDRATAARFSFLLGLVITAGAGAKKTFGVMRLGIPPGETGPILVGLIAAFVSGWFAVWFLVNYLKRNSLRPFVIYRLALAAVILAVAL